MACDSWLCPLDWILTPWFHSRLLDLLFCFFLSFVTWQRSEVKRVQISPRHGSQRPRAEMFSAAVSETLSTSGTLERDCKGGGTLMTKVPWKIETHSNTQLVHTYLRLLAVALYCSFMYTPCRGGLPEHWWGKWRDKGWGEIEESVLSKVQKRSCEQEAWTEIFKSLTRDVRM